MIFKQVEKCSLPKESLLSNEYSHADFSDAYRVPLKDQTASPLSLYIKMVERTPSWVNFLLSIRNASVKLFGLKDVGKLGAVDRASLSEPLIGKKLDLFYIDHSDNAELILSLNDHHLNIKLSLLKSTIGSVNYLTLSSLVKFNNLLGRIYMYTITPFHKIIIKRMLGSLLEDNSISLT